MTVRYEINHSPSFATLDFFLDEFDFVYGQPNSMLSMTPGIGIKAKVAGQTRTGGVRNGIKSLLSGESFFTAIFTAEKPDQHLCLAPETIGDLIPLDLESKGFYITQGAYLASTSSVAIDLEYGGFKGLLSKKGVYLMHARGPGTVFLSSLGAVVHKRLEEGERFVIDNSYVIAFEDTAGYELVKATRGVKDSIMSGESFVNRYTGPGDIFYQTRGAQKSGGILAVLVDFFN